MPRARADFQNMSKLLATPPGEPDIMSFKTRRDLSRYIKTSVRNIQHTSKWSKCIKCWQTQLNIQSTQEHSEALQSLCYFQALGRSHLNIRVKMRKMFRMMLMGRHHEMATSKVANIMTYHQNGGGSVGMRNGAIRRRAKEKKCWAEGNGEWGVIKQTSLSSGLAYSSASNSSNMAMK